MGTTQARTVDEHGAASVLDLEDPRADVEVQRVEHDLSGRK